MEEPILDRQEETSSASSTSSAASSTSISSSTSSTGLPQSQARAAVAMNSPPPSDWMRQLRGDDAGPTPVMLKETLRGSLSGIILPLPRDYFVGGMFHETAGLLLLTPEVVDRYLTVDDDGYLQTLPNTPLYDHITEETFLLARDGTRQIVHRDVNGSLRFPKDFPLLPPPETVPQLETAVTISPQTEISETSPTSSNRIIKPSQIARRTRQTVGVRPATSLPPAVVFPMNFNELCLRPEDLALTEANAPALKRYMLHNSYGLELVEPFSIEAGIIGVNQTMIVAIGQPTLYGQPGQLQAVINDSRFGHYPSGDRPTRYNPAEYDFPAPPEPCCPSSPKLMRTILKTTSESYVETSPDQTPPHSAEYYHNLGYDSNSESEIDPTPSGESVSNDRILLNHASDEIPPPIQTPPPLSSRKANTCNTWWQRAKASLYGLFSSRGTTAGNTSDLTSSPAGQSADAVAASDNDLLTNPRPLYRFGATARKNKNCSNR